MLESFQIPFRIEPVPAIGSLRLQQIEPVVMTQGLHRDAAKFGKLLDLIEPAQCSPPPEYSTVTLGQGQAQSWRNVGRNFGDVDGIDFKQIPRQKQTRCHVKIENPRL